MKFLNDVSDQSNACIMWPYSVDGCGYGCVRVKGKMSRAHRYICAKFHGPKPSSKHHAAHNCGNPRCVNPNHLRWATPKQNQNDRVQHGTHSRGVAHGNSRLSDENIREIRAKRGVKKQAELAEMFGVSATHICQIQNRRKWKHV